MPLFLPFIYLSSLEYQNTFPQQVSAESSSESARPPHISLVYKKLNVQNTVDIRSTKGVGITWSVVELIFSRSVEAVSFQAPEPRGTDLYVSGLMMPKKFPNLTKL